MNYLNNNHAQSVTYSDTEYNSQSDDYSIDTHGKPHFKTPSRTTTKENPKPTVSDNVFKTSYKTVSTPRFNNNIPSNNIPSNDISDEYLSDNDEININNCLYYHFILQ